MREQGPIRVRILARIPAKCELKKQLARWYFLYLPFLASENLGQLSVAIILDINFFSSFLKCISLTVNVFGFIHRKTLSIYMISSNFNLKCTTPLFKNGKIVPYHCTLSAYSSISSLMNYYSKQDSSLKRQTYPLPQNPMTLKCDLDFEFA